MRPGWSCPCRAPHQPPLPQGHRNLRHWTLCSVRSTGCGHRERQCSQGSHCSKMLPAPGRRQPGPLGITGTRTGPACRGPARDPVSHLLADVSAPQMPDWTGQRPPSNPSRRPPATLGALPVLSERLSSLRRAETSPPCCSHRRVLLPTPHGPRGAQHKHSDAQGRGGRTDTPQSSD